MVAYFDFGGLDEDLLSMALQVEWDEGYLPGQQVLAAY